MPLRGDAPTLDTLDRLTGCGDLSSRPGQELGAPLRTHVRMVSAVPSGSWVADADRECSRQPLSQWKYGPPT